MTDFSRDYLGYADDCNECLYKVERLTRPMFGVEMPQFVVIEATTGQPVTDPMTSHLDAETIAWSLNKEIN